MPLMTGAERWPRARIDLGALRHNLRQARRHAHGARLWAVVKADAYGHGLHRAVQALEEADGFAVARLDEALQLRALGVSKPLLLLEGVVDAAAAAAAFVHHLTVVLHQPWQFELLTTASAGAAPLAVWLKIETGMHRLGLWPDQAIALLARIRASRAALHVEGLMTHLANADDPADSLAQRQHRLAQELAQATGMPLSVSNSAGILRGLAVNEAWVRPGIMLYGGSPLRGTAAAALGLRPAMTVLSRVIARRVLPRGAAVGYGGSYSCPEDMPVGVVAIGYGDGYPRHAPSGTPVLIRGQRVPLIGRVSMDMICVDLRAVPEAQVGDEAVLWGAGLPIEDVAGPAGTISYELLCRVAPRVAVETC